MTVTKTKPVTLNLSHSEKKKLETSPEWRDLASTQVIEKCLDIIIKESDRIPYVDKNQVSIQAKVSEKKLAKAKIILKKKNISLSDAMRLLITGERR